MRESGNTCCESTSYIRIDQCHLGCFIVIFIMHVVNHVQCLYIRLCKPCHHLVVFIHDFIIVKYIACDRTIFRSNLYFIFLIDTTVDRVKKTFCKVCACSEELDLFSCLCRRYTAAYRIIVAPYRTHYIIIFILYRTCLNGNVRCVFLKCLRQMRRIQYSQVWLRRWSHVFQCMKETETCLGYLGTSVHTNTGNVYGSPYRVSGEQLIIRLNTSKFNHTEFHCHMVNQFLCLYLCQCSIGKVSFNVDIKECGNTSNTHCGTILCLDGSKISEIQPLECFFCIFCRFGNIITIRSSHLFHAFQTFDLLCKLFTDTIIFAAHAAAFASGKIFLFLFDQGIDTIQCHTTVIADDTSTSVSIRKSGQNLIVTHTFHLWCIYFKYRITVCFVILGKNLMQFRIWLIAIHRAGLLCHTDTTIRHKCTFQWLVCLKTNYFFQIFQVFTDISRAIGCQRGNNLCLHVQNAAFFSFFFLQFLQFAPKLISGFCWSC